MINVDNSINNVKKSNISYYINRIAICQSYISKKLLNLGSLSVFGFISDNVI